MARDDRRRLSRNQRYPCGRGSCGYSGSYGNDVQHFYDVGVAGIHRLLANREALSKARVVIVCAGMEGALPA